MNNRIILYKNSSCYQKIILDKKQILEFQQNRDPYLFVDFATEITPVLFIGVSIPIIIVGARLLKTRPRNPKKSFLDDSDYS